MKYITYILIAVFLSSVLFASLPVTFFNQENVVTLRCTNQKVDVSELQKSAEIIRARLRTMGVDSFRLALEDSVIKIRFANSIQAEQLKDVLLVRGFFGFHETEDKNKLITYLSDNKLLDHLLELSNISDSRSELGRFNRSDLGKANSIVSAINKELSDHNLKLAWSNYPVSEDQWALSLIYSKSVLDGASIVEATADTDKSSASTSINLKMNEVGAKLWKVVTSRNINKEIAIVIDGEVYFAPTVRSEITGGNCMITGDFSGDEADRLLGLILHGPLPLDFELK
jgi:preprotein translocase subunit SecD